MPKGGSPVAAPFIYAGRRSPELTAQGRHIGAVEFRARADRIRQVAQRASNKSRLPLAGLCARLRRACKRDRALARQRPYLRLLVERLNLSGETPIEAPIANQRLAKGSPNALGSTFYYRKCHQTVYYADLPCPRGAGADPTQGRARNAPAAELRPTERFPESSSVSRSMSNLIDRFGFGGRILISIQGACRLAQCGTNIGSSVVPR